MKHLPSPQHLPEDHDTPEPQGKDVLKKTDHDNETLAQVPVVSGSDTPTIISNTRIIRKEIDEATQAFPYPKKPLSVFKTSSGDSTEQFKMPEDPYFADKPRKITSKVEKIKRLSAEDLPQFLDQQEHLDDKKTPVLVPHDLNPDIDGLRTIRVQSDGYTIIDENIIGTPIRELAHNLGIKIPVLRDLKELYPEETPDQNSLEELFVTETRLKFREQYESKRFIKKIGMGGIGSVYLVYDELLHKHEILKLFHKQFREAMKGELKNEIYICAKLAKLCPNIVAPNELAKFHNNDLAYFASYIDGGMTAEASLMKEKDQKRGLNQIENITERLAALKEMTRIMIIVCRALEVAHQNQIVHRDIKPENMLVDAAGVPYLTDFGMARHTTSSSITDAKSENEFKAISGEDPATDKSLGSPHFMAPEQALRFVERHTHHIPLDPRSDIFAIGASMYYLCTNDTVNHFSGTNIQNIMSGIAYEYKLPKEPAINRVLEPANEEEKEFNRTADVLIPAIECCLQKDPDGRFQTMEELADFMEQIFEDPDSKKTVSKKAPPSELPKKHPGQKILLTITAALILLTANIKYQKPKATSKKQANNQKEVLTPNPTRLEISGPEQRLNLIIDNKEIDVHSYLRFNEGEKEIDENRGIVYAQVCISENNDLKKLTVLQILQLASGEFVIQMVDDYKVSQFERYHTLEELLIDLEKKIQDIKNQKPDKDVRVLQKHASRNSMTSGNISK